MESVDVSVNSFLSESLLPYLSFSLQSNMYKYGGHIRNIKLNRAYATNSNLLIKTDWGYMIKFNARSNFNWFFFVTRWILEQSLSSSCQERRFQGKSPNIMVALSLDSMAMVMIVSIDPIDLLLIIFFLFYLYFLLRRAVAAFINVVDLLLF